MEVPTEVDEILLDLRGSHVLLQSFAKKEEDASNGVAQRLLFDAMLSRKFRQRVAGSRVLLEEGKGNGDELIQLLPTRTTQT